MKYSDEFTKQVLAKTDLVKLISSYTPLRESEGVYKGQSPFTDVPSDSLIVDKEKQVFKDFATGVSGNAMIFLMKKEKLTPDQAIEKLAKSNGIAITDASYYKETKAVTKRNLYAVYKDAALFYANQLKTENGVEGKEYLTKRSLTDKTIHDFQLGFAPAKNNPLYHYLKKQGYTDDLMLQSGLIKQGEDGRPYDYFRNRVMFPIKDRDGNVVAFGGRVLDDSKPKYLNSPKSPIFNKSGTLFGMNIAHTTSKNHYIVCEGYMDVISMHQAGYTNAVAPLGTALTQAHIPQLEIRDNGKRTVAMEGIILAFDSDEAGQKAIQKAINRLSVSDTLTVKVLDMSPHKDPNEFIEHRGTQEMDKCLRASTYSENYMLKTIMASVERGEKTREEAMRQCVDVFMKMSQSRVRSHDAKMKQVAETMFVEELNRER